MDNIVITNVRGAVASHSSSTHPLDLDRSRQSSAFSDSEDLNGRNDNETTVNRHPKGRLSAEVSDGAKNSRDLKRKTTGEWSQRQSVSTATADSVGMPSSLPKVQVEECCLCLGPATRDHQQSDEKIKLIENLCLVMTNNEEMNKEGEMSEGISNTVVAFCVDCESRVKELWEVEQTIQLAQIRKLEIVSGIEKAALEGELLTPGTNTSMTGTSIESVSKLRKSIIESKYC